MATTDELATIRRRLAAATSTDWQRLDHYNEAQAEFHAHAAADMATLLAALDAAEAEAARLQVRIVALQTALAQATREFRYHVAPGTVTLTARHCRCCGASAYDTQAISHHEGCPVQVLAESYREEGGTDEGQ